jgi:uncharacterized membrane protein
LVLSIFIIYKLFVAVDGLLNNVVAELLARMFGLQFGDQPIPGLGLVAVILIILLTGAVARNYVGRQLIALGNRIVGRIPLMNRIYTAIQQIVEALFSERSEVFKKAVLLEYPRKDIFSIAFVTQDTKGVIQETLDVDVVSVFLPTTPNPTSGFLLFVPKKDILELDLSVEEALKLVISGGAIVPKGRFRGTKIEQATPASVESEHAGEVGARRSKGISRAAVGSGSDRRSG